MGTKTVNYTPEMTAELTEGYQACETDEGRQAFVEGFAAKHGKKVSSVRAKLVREGTYVKPERTAKRSATKAELVAAIAARTGANPDVIGSLEKATAKALRVIRDALPENEEISEG